jgi:hypothetical protein
MERTVNVPTLPEAERYLEEAAARNPGSWVQHSVVVARAARAIAGRHPALDPAAAYVLGLLHDIGRRAGGPGVPDVRHILDGYAFLRAEGFEASARICLTHSFPIKEVDAFASRWECPAEERRFVQAYLNGVEYSAYDRLIQLCDALALPSGFCLIEKRLVDVALRHGFNDHTLAKWRAYLGLRQEFDAAIGRSIYRVLPGVVANTFGDGRGRAPRA